MLRFSFKLTRIDVILKKRAGKEGRTKVEQFGKKDQKNGIEMLDVC